MEDMAKVIADPEGSTTGDLELILEQPFIKEPQEHRSAEDFTVVGTRLGEAGTKKGSKPKSSKSSNKH